MQICGFFIQTYQYFEENITRKKYTYIISESCTFSWYPKHEKKNFLSLRAQGWNAEDNDKVEMRDAHAPCSQVKLKSPILLLAYLAINVTQNVWRFVSPYLH